eukprot:43317-Ditylum_brightwellii.AAC.1
MEKLKTSIKDIKLSSYPGENIVNMNQHIRALCDRLWGAGYCDKNLLHCIANNPLSCVVCHEISRMIIILKQFTRQVGTIYINNSTMHPSQMSFYKYCSSRNA